MGVNTWFVVTVPVPETRETHMGTREEQSRPRGTQAGFAMGFPLEIAT